MQVPIEQASPAFQRGAGQPSLLATKLHIPQLPFTPAGVAFLASALICGVLSEPLVWLVTRYRRFGWGEMTLLGALAGLLFFLVFGLLLGTANFALPTQLAIGAAATASCVLGALLAKGLGDAVARTGVLRGVAVGREEAEV